MEAIKISTAKSKMPKKHGISAKALEDIGEKFSKINKCIQEGKEVPSELTKNFVTFPLSDDPYSELE